MRPGRKKCLTKSACVCKHAIMATAALACESAASRSPVTELLSVVVSTRSGLYFRVPEASFHGTCKIHPPAGYAGCWPLPVAATNVDVLCARGCTLISGANRSPEHLETYR